MELCNLSYLPRCGRPSPDGPPLMAFDFAGFRQLVPSIQDNELLAALAPRPPADQRFPPVPDPGWHSCSPMSH